MKAGLTFKQCVRVRPTLRPTPYVGLEGCVTLMERSIDREAYIYTLDFPSFGGKEWASFPSLADDVMFFEWELEPVGTFLDDYQSHAGELIQTDSAGRVLGLSSQGSDDTE